MINKVKRPHREHLDLPGLVRIDEQEYDISVKNLSITGLLAVLHQKTASDEGVKDLFNQLRHSTLAGVFIPGMRLAAEAEVTRVDVDQGKLLVSLEFDEVHHHADRFISRLLAG